MSDALATSVVVRAVGWALLQSLWQATLVAVATGIILAALRRGSASIRYAVGCIGLVAVAASFGATAITAIGDAPTPPAGRPGVPHRLAATPAPVDHGVLTGLLGGPVAVDARESFDPPPPSLRERFDAWSRVIVPVWLGGVLLLSVRFLVSWVMTRRVWRTPGTAVSVEWRARVDQIANRLNVTRAIRVVESAAVAVPTVIGGVRPVVLLPAAVFTGISVPQLEAILAHELAHIRRHDYLVNLLQTVLDIVFFYHPACWWISRAIRREREHCCDDAAVAYCGDRLAYAEALADLESLRDNPALLGVAATGGRLVERIRRILLPNRADRSVAAMSAVASIVLVLVLGTSGLALVSAAQSAAPGAGRQIPPDRGVIAGSVSNDAGASIGGATIDVMAADDRDRGPLGSTTLRATAGDDGRFEVEDVPPGRYLIRASAPGHLASQYGQKSASAPAAGVQVSRGRITSRVDIRLQRAGTIGGRILTNEGEGLPGVEIEVLREPGSAGTQRMPVGFAQTEAGGEFRVRNLEPGEYLVRAYASGGLRPTKNGSPRAYTSTFYPDVTTPDLAQRIHIGSGDTVYGIDFTLATSPLHVISGRLRDPSGASVAGVAVEINAMGAGGPYLERRSVTVTADGRFAFRDLSPGNYMLHVEDRSNYRRWLGSMRMIGVSGDVDDMDIDAENPTHVRGRLLREGGEPLPFDPAGVRIVIEYRRGPGGLMSGFGTDGRIQRDGSFGIDAPTGAANLRISDLPSRWAVKSIALDGADVTDQPIDFGGGGATRRLDVTLTQRTSSITGTVIGERNQAAPSAVVLVFPEDRSRWQAPERLVRMVTARFGGRFEIADLPAADYRVVAVESLAPWATTDPELFDRLWSSATPARTKEGEQQTVTVKLTATPAGATAP